MSNPITTTIPLRPLFLTYLAFLSALWLVTGTPAPPKQ